MIDLRIDPLLKEKAPDLCLGLIRVAVKVAPSPPELLALIKEKEERLSASLALESIGEFPQIKASREAYKALGKNPSRYRNSAEALMRRILQGKGLYLINNIVEINNLTSLEAACSVGSYDVSCLQLPVSFRIGVTGYAQGGGYKGIGKDELNVENLPVLADQAGQFGSPTSDSQRAMITPSAEDILMILFSFAGGTGLQRHMENTSVLLERFAEGKGIETAIVI